MGSCSEATRPGTTCSLRADACTQTQSVVVTDSSTQACQTRAGRPPCPLEGSSIGSPGHEAMQQDPGAFSDGICIATKQARTKNPRTKHSGRINLCSSRLSLPQFVETPSVSLRNMLLDLLEQMNARGSGCCRFHVAAARI